jgi:hypothetical protein
MKKNILNEEISRIKNMMGRINESDYTTEMNPTHNIPMDEEEDLNEIGMYWLTKIKVNSPKPLSPKKKLQTARAFQMDYNGRIAVEFEPGEWYDWEGKIDDIDAYEKDVHNNLYGDFGGSHEDKVATRERFKRHNGNAPMDTPHMDVKNI